jgi:ubiquinone/menaquinone biosynthesis C-methylase UbiE
MSTNVRRSRWSKFVAWLIAGLFVSGFFFSSVDAWTGPILGVWFVGTQKPRRGFLWMLAFVFLPSLLFGWRKIPLTGPAQALEYIGWALLAATLGVLPFSFHRLVSPRLPGFLATLPFPLAAVAFHLLAPPLPYTSHAFGTPILIFVCSWFAAIVVWMWNQSLRASRFALCAIAFAAIFVLAGGLAPYWHSSSEMFPPTLLPGNTLAWICLAGVAAFTVWALLNPPKYQSWAQRPQSVALLRSPFTASPLQVVNDRGGEALASPSGERFPIRNGIPVFLKPEDLTGDNGKYNHLYETIGGFYDDTQRVASALKGLDLDSYFLNYMGLLEVKPGDSVLETSVGTGLNFKYLPRGVKLSGLDLSPEMLANCQANLRRWKIEADLYLGNAESLPFADSSFDVVFTCGGFNFFSDRAKALREMIRVAKPGGHLMIEDETEEYVKSTYEKIPYTSSFYSKRKQTVTVPIDLVPPEMEDIRVNMLKDGKFYAITFRKPAAA